VVEQLPSKSKALSTNPRAIRKKKKEKKERKKKLPTKISILHHFKLRVPIAVHPS
jgi:hypothetical protein